MCGLGLEPVLCCTLEAIDFENSFDDSTFLTIAMVYKRIRVPSSDH